MQVKYPLGAVRRSSELIVGMPIWWVWAYGNRPHTGVTTVVDKKRGKFHVNVKEDFKSKDLIFDLAQWNINGPSRSYPKDFVFKNYWHAWAHHERLTRGLRR